MTNNFTTFLLAVLCLATIAFAGLRDPFVPGFSMGTQGAVITGNGATGREPWTNASACGDTAGYGVALCGVSYYNSLGGITGPEGIAQVFGGGWLAGRHLVGKLSVANLNAFNMYYEQTGIVSLGTSAIPFMRLSIEATGYRSGVRIPGSLAFTIAEAGVSAWVPWSWAAFSFRLEHLAIEHGGVVGADAPPTFRCGIHTIHNRFGGQGAIIRITPDDASPVCFTVGEEYRLTPGIAFNAAFSNNPVFLSFGIAFQLSKSDFAIALVSHEQLGWSQGFSAGYYKTTGRLND